MKTLGERLRWARATAGLSARELDSLAKLSPGHTAAIEAERRLDPSSKTSLAIARALGVSLDWLVDGTGIAPNERKLRRTGTDG